MTTFTHINTSSLPSDVLDFKHDDFYNFVEIQCGPIQADILKLQLISDATIFIECNDPTEIMKYNSDKLNELKAESCLMTTDGLFIVLPGITASFNNLKKCLLKKLDESNKESKRNKHVSNMSTPLTAPFTSQSKSIDELRSHVIKSIDQWIEKYRHDFNLKPNSALVETIDYHVQFIDNVTGQKSVVITCACGTIASLSRHTNNGYCQVSNFYRHLERRSCSMMSGKLNQQMNLDNCAGSANMNSQSTQSSISSSTPALVIGSSKNDRNRKRSSSSNKNPIGQRSKRRQI